MLMASPLPSACLGNWHRASGPHASSPDMRDVHPESEVGLWFRITKAWLAYHEDFLGNETLANEEERKLLGALIAISTGVDDLSKLGVPAEVGSRLVQCYDDPAN
jgi:hypothetical protein